MGFRSGLTLAAALMLGGAPAHAAAAPADPAAAQVEGFYADLTAALHASGLSAARLKPAVERTFNLPVMAQLAVGPAWSEMTAADRAAVVAALSRYTVARYVKDLSAAHDVTFVVDPAVQVRGADRLVKSEVRAPGETPTKLYYRLREYSGAWQAVDVFENGVSEIATQRADFTGALAKGGAGALVRKLDEATARLK
jgi:phospholipid transport system substrate-binding protein